MIAVPSRGFTLVEVLITVTISAVLMVALTGVMQSALDHERVLQDRRELTADAHFAMARILRFLRAAEHVYVPQIEVPLTAPTESVRDVLVLSLDPALDRDGDGFPDADNDKDGRINEDAGDDVNFDGASGASGEDDDFDGVTDELFSGSVGNDDEDGALAEDPVNGIDDDGDGLVDEDSGADANGDGCPGLCGVDDDADGVVDEGAADDDDEDGLANEDWIDTVTWRVVGSWLQEDLPDIDPLAGDDRSTYSLAGSVSDFKVTRTASDGLELITVTLELTDDDISVSLTGAVQREAGR